MKKLTRLFWACLLVVSACDGQTSFSKLSQEAVGAAQPHLATAEKRVTDAANILEDGAEVRLTEQLKLLERTTGHQMVVVTVPSLEGREIEKYTIDLARRWGIGRRKHNDGIVVLVAPNERQVRIEVGLGLEQVVTNDFAATVIRTDMVPKFREGDYAAGISAGVITLIERLSTR